MASMGYYHFSHDNKRHRTLITFRISFICAMIHYTVQNKECIECLDRWPNTLAFYVGHFFGKSSYLEKRVDTFGNGQFCLENGPKYCINCNFTYIAISHLYLSIYQFISKYISIYINLYLHFLLVFNNLSINSINLSTHTIYTHLYLNCFTWLVPICTI